MRYVIIVDMQNDFITGALGSKEAQEVARKMVDFIPTLADGNTAVIMTKDSHDKDYLSTLEGKKLPVKHCQKFCSGWHIVPEIYDTVMENNFILPTSDEGIEKGIVYKDTFGSIDLANGICELAAFADNMEPHEFMIMGVCTDICVISNAMLLKIDFPNVPIKIMADYCAGVTPERHENALKAMEYCHMDIIREEN